jgi:hypothetical protein
MPTLLNEMRESALDATNTLSTLQPPAALAPAVCAGSAAPLQQRSTRRTQAYSVKRGTAPTISRQIKSSCSVCVRKEEQQDDHEERASAGLHHDVSHC